MEKGPEDAGPLGSGEAVKVVFFSREYTYPDFLEVWKDIRPDVVTQLGAEFVEGWERVWGEGDPSKYRFVFLKRGTTIELKRVSPGTRVGDVYGLNVEPDDRFVSLQ